MLLLLGALLPVGTRNEAQAARGRATVRARVVETPASQDLRLQTERIRRLWRSGAGRAIPVRDLDGGRLRVRLLREGERPWIQVEVLGS